VWRNPLGARAHFLSIAILIAVATGWLFKAEFRRIKFAGVAILVMCWAGQWWHESSIARLTVLPLNGSAAVFFDPPGTKKDLLVDCGRERAVKGIEGVENVDNQIEILPTSPADDRIRVLLYRQIYGYPILERYALPVVKPIRIIVKNGHVALEGVVDNETDKNVAGIQARSVPGVFDVRNNLQVEKP